MFAKRFFFVCAGLLCLAFAYHLGATNAHSKAPSQLDGTHIWTGITSGLPVITAVSGRTFITWGWSGAQGGQLIPGQPVAFPAPVPGTARVIATLASPQVAVLENGDAYFVDFDGTWEFAGNIQSGP